MSQRINNLLSIGAETSAHQPEKLRNIASGYYRLRIDLDFENRRVYLRRRVERPGGHYFNYFRLSIELNADAEQAHLPGLAVICFATSLCTISTIRLGFNDASRK